ncbi:MAG: ATP-binding protein [Candidatus Bathyarchaeia archaeon]
MGLSFSSKVSLAIALVIVFTIVIHESMEITIEANRRIEEMIDEKKSLNEIMAFSIESAEEHVWTAYKKYIIRKAAEPEDIVYCRLVKRTGEIFLSNIEEERGMFINDPAIFTNETVVIHDVYDGETITTVVSPTYEGKTLWLGVSLKEFYAAINQMIVSALIMALVVVAIFTPVSYFIVSRSLSPLKKLTSLCDDISKGTFSVRSNVQSEDEIGTLSRTFDDMAGKLEKMREEIRRSERLSAIGQSATMVGHDLRNPLQAIENATYYLNNELSRLPPTTPIPRKTMEMLRVISNSVDYADKIVRDLKDFASTKKPILKKTDVNAIVKDALSQVETPENVELITELSYLPEIKVDKDMIKRLFVNLAINGIQAMENGGTLKVSTKKTKGFVEVSFKDTGIGIAKEDMKKIFTPFFTTKAQGMGMGLTICKKLVDAHGGSIKVESEEGKGSTFTVKLPIQQENGGEKLGEE